MLPCIIIYAHLCSRDRYGPADVRAGREGPGGNLMQGGERDRENCWIGRILLVAHLYPGDELLALLISENWETLWASGWREEEYWTTQKSYGVMAARLEA
ncbi:hypothetical protein BaRGS_00018658 [Batillaria attramentaria]|uniref:Uncharacterized protein n=1 Tax=Batillaria attramentaria TaxID=370345 RepID=A0ABD0KSA3_9CAEN